MRKTKCSSGDLTAMNPYVFRAIANGISNQGWKTSIIEREKLKSGKQNPDGKILSITIIEKVV